MGRKARERAQRKGAAKVLGAPTVRTRAWVVAPPTLLKSGQRAQRVPELYALVAAHRDVMVERGEYSSEEMDAFANGEVSWAAPEPLMAGPLTTVARVGDEVVGGIELWQQQRDGFWYLDMLIRDPASKYKGVGVDVYRTALRWWLYQFGRRGHELRVHSMVREERAVRWWTRQVGRQPDYTGAYVRNGFHFFPAVGWILYPPRSARGAPASAAAPANDGPGEQSVWALDS